MFIQIFRYSLIFFIIFGIFSACSPNNLESAEGAKSRTADRLMFDAEIAISQAGKPSGSLKADSLLFFDKEDKIFGYGIEVEFFEEGGRHTGSLSADSGWIDNRTQRITVWGEVFFAGNEGVRLWTDSLAYYPELSRIRTSAGVKIEKQGEFITGGGLDSDLEFKDIRITQNVSGRLSQD